MKLFHVPYRWVPRCWWENISSILGDLTCGVKNIIRWTPIIWEDEDWDWSFLGRIMEYKLTRMARNELTNGHHTTSQRDGKNQLVCALLLRRLIADEYADGYKDVPDSQMSAYFKSATQRQRNDQRYLGLLIGKHLTHWWD